MNAVAPAPRPMYSFSRVIMMTVPLLAPPICQRASRGTTSWYQAFHCAVKIGSAVLR
jgi:hypothetical protein